MSNSDQFHQMLLAHSPRLWNTLRKPSIEDPLRVLISGCILGLKCGVDGSDYGMGGALTPLVSLPTVEALGFCPEDAGIGTPRTMPDIHGGDGFGVLRGTARVLDQFGADLTVGMIRGAEKMVEYAVDRRIELAVLTDASAACGSQVISDGCRFTEPRKYTAWVGVAAAMLLEAGIPVLSQRDYASLERLLILCQAPEFVSIGKPDHHLTPWYTEYFAK
ncbi:MAG: DUF523 domain-containing protein [Ignavibacteria bacterium]|nr:DUF523 domain-containing protein [Ignavibacteria bacterium]